jgi:hypothetical protein
MACRQDEKWAGLFCNRDVLDGQAFAVIAAVAMGSECAVTCALWRIVDDPHTKTCTSTVAMVTLAPDANGTYAVAATTVHYNCAVKSCCAFKHSQHHASRFRRSAGRRHQCTHASTRTRRK